MLAWSCLFVVFTSLYSVDYIARRCYLSAIIGNPVEDHLLVLLDPRTLVRRSHSLPRNNVRQEWFFCCAPASISFDPMLLMNITYINQYCVLLTVKCVHICLTIIFLMTLNIQNQNSPVLPWLRDAMSSYPV